MTRGPGTFTSATQFSAQFSPLMQIPVPAHIEHRIARLTADTIAIAAHARENGIGACAVDAPDPMSDGSAEIWGTDHRTNAPIAALLNGTAAEALDFQEVLIDGRNNGHAAVVIIPALLALSSAGSIAGDRLLRGLWIAFCANIFLARALGRGHRAGMPGFRTTSLTAPIAAALGAGFLLSDDPVIAGHSAAIGAASLPAGLLAAMSPDANSFSVDKDLSVGFSARHAVDCALLAQKGATGPSSALAGPRSWLNSYGFGTQIEDHLSADPLAIDLAAYALKFFPSNFGCQCAIRLAIELSQQVAPGDVETLEVHVKSSSATSLSATDLSTHVSARFSLAYSIASAFVRGRSVLADFDEEALQDPAVRAFMDKITVIADEDYQTIHETEGVFPAKAILHLKDGGNKSAFLKTPQEGMSDGEVDAMFATKLKSLCTPPVAAMLLELSGTGTNTRRFEAFKTIFSKDGGK